MYIIKRTLLLQIMWKCRSPVSQRHITGPMFYPFHRRMLENRDSRPGQTQQHAQSYTKPTDEFLRLKW